MPKVKKDINKFFKDVWGENPLTFYFSFDGRFNRLQFWGALITINLFLRIVTEQGFVILTTIASFVVFCATLAAFQKRCRDINYKGTLVVLVYTGTFLLTDYYNHITLPKVLENVWRGFGVLYVCFSPEEKRKSRISFLLCSNAHIYISEFVPSSSCSGG